MRINRFLSLLVFGAAVAAQGQQTDTVKVDSRTHELKDPSDFFSANVIANVSALAGHYDTIGAASTAQAASLQKSSNLSDLADAAAARGHLGLAAVAASGAYSDLSGKPSLATVATSGSYTDLSNKPTIPAAQVNSDWNASSGVAQIANKPTLATVATSGAYSDLSGKPSLATVATSGAYSDLSGKPSLATVATSGSYTDLSNKPTIPAAQVNSDWNAGSGVAQVLNKPTLATVATSGAYSDLSGKPSLGTAAAQNTSAFDAAGAAAGIISTDGTLGGGSPSTSSVPSQSAVQTYVSAHAGSGTVAPIGTIFPSDPGDGHTYLACNGQVLTQSSYPALFAKLGHRPQFKWLRSNVVALSYPHFSGPAGIAYGNGVYVIGTSAGYIATATSPAGPWTPQTGASPGGGYSGVLCFGNGYFVMRDGSQNYVYYSTDGVSWTQVACGVGGLGFTLTYQNGVYWGATSNGCVYYSTNGTTWTQTSVLSATSTTNSILCYLGGNYLCVPSTSNNSTGSNVFYSTNGTSWSAFSPATQIGASGVANYVGYDGTYHYIFDTLQGDIWSCTTLTGTYTKIYANAITVTNGQSGVMGPCDPTAGLVSIVANSVEWYTTNGFATIGIAPLVVEQGPVQAYVTMSAKALNKAWGQALPFLYFAGANPMNASVDGKTWYQSGNYPEAYIPIMGAGSIYQIGQWTYWNGYYFAVGSAGPNIYYAAPPYTPSTQFQVPILTNSDGTNKVIRAL